VNEVTEMSFWELDAMMFMNVIQATIYFVECLEYLFNSFTINCWQSRPT